MPDEYTNGNGTRNGRTDPLAGLPWWVRAVFLVGVPSAIALGLVWSDRAQLAEQIHTNGVLLRQIDADARAHDARVVLRFQELSTATSETNRILTASCVNAAKTAEARERCIGR
ncbi:MAG TPA: hypothetical protein PLT35_08080 [Vicinamibacterales bacterium]|nr:hypothetical protein [Vicinamibacterales bacterium]